MDDVDRRDTDMLDSDDVEADCWPTSAHATSGPYTIPRSEYSKLKDIAHEIKHSDECCDSGYEKSVESPNSGNLPSDANEGRLESNTDFGVDLNFKNLSIDIKPSKFVSSKLDSIDEGYTSVQSEPHKHLIALVSEGQRTELQKSELQTSCDEIKTRDHNEELIVEIYQQDEDGDTQLHTSIIQLLENVALDFISIAPHFSLLNLCNNYLQTPLHLAVITKQPNLVRKLITAGAQVDVRDHKGNTPLHIAAKEGCAIITKRLLEPIQYNETKENLYDIPYQHIPQNLNARNYEGQLCVHLAAEGSHLDVLAILLENGADINARDGKSGRTILHYAAESGNWNLLTFLFHYSSSLDLNTFTYGGLTAIVLAKGRGYKDIMATLRRAGAQCDSSSDDSSEEDMNEDSYTDIMIAGQPVINGPY